MEGWVKLHRQLLEKPIWLNSTAEQKAILITLLLMANHKPRQWEWGGEKFAVKPGQFVTSIARIAENAGKGITVKNVRTALARFEKLGFLANESTRRGRLVTIVNWELYQVGETETGKERAKDGQRPGKGLAPNKNERRQEGKKEKTPRKRGRAFDEASDEYRLALRLRERILGNLPSARVPNADAKSLAGWSQQVDYMIRLDQRKTQDIALVIDWCQRSSFWKANIMSTTKLRKQFDTLVLQMEREGIYLASKKRRSQAGDYAIYDQI